MKARISKLYILVYLQYKIIRRKRNYIWKTERNRVNLLHIKREILNVAKKLISLFLALRNHSLNLCSLNLISNCLINICVCFQFHSCQEFNPTFKTKFLCHNYVMTIQPIILIQQYCACVNLYFDNKMEKMTWSVVMNPNNTEMMSGSMLLITYFRVFLLFNNKYVLAKTDYIYKRCYLYLKSLMLLYHANREQNATVSLKFPTRTDSPVTAIP